MLRFVIICDL